MTPISSLPIFLGVGGREKETLERCRSGHIREEYKKIRLPFIIRQNLTNSLHRRDGLDHSQYCTHRPRRKDFAERKKSIDKDPFLRHQYESRILREFFDFTVREKEILQRRYGIG